MFRQVLRYSVRKYAPAIAPRATVLSSPTRHVSAMATRAYSLSTSGEDIEDKIDQISVNEYNSISEEYLESLADSLEDLSEKYPQIDCELSHGVMTLTIPPHGTYVINKQPPNKQIWLSSPVSGPKRYDLIGGQWITLRDGSALTELITEEVSSALGTEVSLDIEG
ncbi:Frataxin homolog, mitochondrial precursor Contains: Frataxin homolog intermediate form [Scheffersomyces stipitis CBS 6054]|uniref:ferroxidase n=1 Tax=Scheffersomyces stipitis (strain ATCC 58785 / CBS 6054 / NBRC 10063 / NRRL Y-11545) TaxID=322104 RepID=A3LYQ3_PICST|nr:Frataxin homolog, mitochondrial precursor Contains: Frataxin homolog intermediate form [Scheffersomyces stipitis CBS 6054]ABN68014.1 Frataxin homolog, mitochondrial precursor Contains: Frataxin homolog intermediate form [Scheffersomyces stipitis CBS 6054]